MYYYPINAANRCGVTSESFYTVQLKNSPITNAPRAGGMFTITLFKPIWCIDQIVRDRMQNSATFIGRAQNQLRRFAADANQA